MPPHRLLPTLNTITSRNLWRGANYLALLATLTLAGCATNARNQLAESNTSATRYSFLSETKSDPLGAYLASNKFSGYSSSQYPNPTVSPKALASTALDYLGTKYKYGGGTPYTGFDCSGLVIYAAKKSLGLKLPRRSAEIAHEGISVKRNELKKGDLVFFNTRGSRNSHVGIYLGNHKFVHAPRTGAVVRVENMEISYWKKRYNGARRLTADASQELALTK